MRIKFFLFGVVLIILIIFFENACILDNYFLGDDFNVFSDECLNKYFLIKNSPDLWLGALVEDLFSSFHPPTDEYLRIIPLLSWRCNYLLFGINPLGYHLVIVISHIINSILVLFFISLILKDRYLSLFIAILFAINPINSEALSSIVYRADVFSMTFYLISLITFIFFRQQKRKTYRFLSLASFFAALFCKEAALGLPFIIIVLDLVLDNREGFARPQTGIDRLKLHIPYFVILAFYLVIRFTTLAKYGGYGFLVRGYPEFYWVFKDLGLIRGGILYLFRVLFYPYKYFLFSVNRFIFTNYIFLIKLLTIIIILPLLIGIFYNYNLKKYFNKRLILFSILFIFFNCIPIFFLIHSIDYNKGGLVNSRYLYLPSIGFSTLLGIAIWSLPNIFIKRVMTLSLLIFYSILLFGNNLAWSEASKVSYQIPHQTKLLHPLSKNENKTFYFLPTRDELYFYKGIPTYQSQGHLNNAFKLIYGFPVKVYIIDKKKIDEDSFFSRVSGEIMAITENFDLHSAVINSYILKWNPEKNKVEDLTLQIENKLR